MKKAILLLIVLSLLLCAACGEKPVTHANGSLRIYPFEVSVEKSDLIARVKLIGMKEKDEPYAHTVFECKIIETYYGEEEPNDIAKFRIDGNSRLIYDYVPVYSFEKGSEYIIFFKHEWENAPALYNDIYMVVGGYTGICEKIVHNGEEYIIYRGNWKEDLNEILENEVITEKVKQYKLNNLKKYERISKFEVYKRDKFIDAITRDLETKGEKE